MESLTSPIKCCFLSFRPNSYDWVKTHQIRPLGRGRLAQLCSFTVRSSSNVVTLNWIAFDSFITLCITSSWLMSLPTPSPRSLEPFYPKKSYKETKALSNSIFSEVEGADGGQGQSLNSNVWNTIMPIQLVNCLQIDSISFPKKNKFG